MSSFTQHYLQYTANTEAPAFFHRWACLTGIGAFLGRDYYFKHGHFSINPNMYVKLIGTPGVRKSTAIKIFKSLLKQVGYDTIAANKTSKEKFLLDLAEGFTDSPSVDDILEQNIFGDGTTNLGAAECLIAADEFNNFIGLNNLEFISLLTELWDYEGTYENKIKNGKSVSINNPTISILGGNTPTGLSQCFPPEIVGQGFLSRLILVYSEPTRQKITFPRPPSQSESQEILDHLVRIKSTVLGPATLTPEAEDIIDKIYKSPTEVHDVRFDSYFSRRLNHLIKLSLVVAATYCSTAITAEHVIEANTILVHTEHLMPKALGEFGKAKNSDVVHKVMTALDAAKTPQSMKDLWKHVSADLTNFEDVGDILRNLVAAEKVQQVSAGFLPIKRVMSEQSTQFTNFDYLTQEERGFIL